MRKTVLKPADLRRERAARPQERFGDGLSARGLFRAAAWKASFDQKDRLSVGVVSEGHGRADQAVGCQGFRQHPTNRLLELRRYATTAEHVHGTHALPVDDSKSNQV
jgi:hypothetical protein